MSSKDSIRTSRLVHNISLDLPGTKQERRCFDFFRSCTAPELCGYFTEDFWQRNILQASFSHPALRHAIVALGSLHESHKAAGKIGCQIEGPDYFAMRQHAKAVSNLRASLSKDSQLTDVALMSCIIFACFDSLTGQLDSSITHLRSGFQILSNAPSVDTDSYFRIFTRLGLQAVFFLDARRKENQVYLAALMVPDPCTRLEKFSSILEARHSFNSIIGCLMYFLYSTPISNGWTSDQQINIETAYTGELLRLDVDHEKLVKFRRYLRMATDMGVDNQEFLNPFRLPESIRNTWVQHQQRDDVSLQEWSRKFDAFLSESTLKLSSKDLQGAIMLKIHWTVCVTMVGGTIKPSCYGTNDFIASYRQIISLCTAVVRSKADIQPSTFSTELGIIAPLYFTALYCRDIKIRRQALDLLSTPRKEGMWDSQVVVFIIERIIALEESGVKVPNEKMDLWSDSKTVDAPVINRTLREVIETAKIELHRLSRSQGQRMST